MQMLWIKAFHIVAMVAWFAGLFYLPRLFVYHAEATDTPSIKRFCIMESRLYRAITTPAAIITTLLGGWLMWFNLPYYLHAGWMHAKLTLVIILWVYHLFCGHFVRVFARHANVRSALFYRVFNEGPTLLLLGIVLLVVLKPS